MFCTRTPIIITHQLLLLLDTTVAKPPRNHTVEERDTYMTDQASLIAHNQKQLKQDVLSWFTESNRKKNGSNDDDDLSVVSSSKRPNALKRHNKFETAKH